MADLKNLTLQFKNPKTNETFKGYMKTSEDLVILADGTTLRDLKDALWNTIAMQAFQMLQHTNAPHLTTDDLSEIVADVTYDDTTGTLSVTTCGGETTAIASNLNKSVSKFEKYVAAADDAEFTEGHTILKLELVNGDVYKVDLTDFVNDNIKIDNAAYTAAYTAEPAATQADIATYANAISFTPDAEANLTSTIYNGTVYEKSDGRTVDNIGFIMTGAGNCSTAKAKLFFREADADTFSSTDFTSDGNTTPKFNVTMNYTLGKWYEVYFIIYDTIAGVADTAVYQSKPALIMHKSAAETGSEA